MQPTHAASLLAERPVAVPTGGLRATSRHLVLALPASGDASPVVETVRRVAADPALLARIARIVVVQQGAGPVVLPEALRPLIRVVEQRDLGPAGGVARALHEALAEEGADAVLLVADGGVLDVASVLPAVDAVRADDRLDVAAWIAPGDDAACGAVLLPFDAVRGTGSAHPDLTGAVLADLVLRAEATGFLPLRVSGGVDGAPVPTVRDRTLLAMLHEPVSARSRVLRAGAGGPLDRVGLWASWRTRRREARAAALVRAAPEGWSVRFLEAGGTAAA